MKRQKFAILDRETPYAWNLMEYLAERQSLPFETMVLDNEESLEEYAAKGGIDLLLVSESMMNDRIRRLSIKKLIILSEGQTREAQENYPAVYKYQSSEDLVAEVMSCYARQEMPRAVYVAKKEMEVLGIYSPIGRCGKTCFALTLGQILAKEKRVLYLNLEDYAGFGGLLGKETPSDISDVMYFIRQNGGSALLKLNSAIQKIGRLDYLPPAFSLQDLAEISLPEWTKLLEELVSCSSYEVILMDIGQTVRDLFPLLDLCGRIYTPICEDAAAEAKLCQYEQILRELDYEEILEKTRKLLLPYCELPMGGESFLERLPEGEMGAFVRELLEEESGREEWNGTQTEGIPGTARAAYGSTGYVEGTDG